MSTFKALFLMGMMALVTGCCCDRNPCCDPAPRPYCCPRACDMTDCCDNSGYCARPYLWDNY